MANLMTILIIVLHVKMSVFQHKTNVHFHFHSRTVVPITPKQNIDEDNDDQPINNCDSIESINNGNSSLTQSFRDGQKYLIKLQPTSQSRAIP